jgi:hypothetical protein
MTIPFEHLEADKIGLIPQDFNQCADWVAAYGQKYVLYTPLTPIIPTKNTEESFRGLIVAGYKGEARSEYRLLLPDEIIIEQLKSALRLAS